MKKLLLIVVLALAVVAAYGFGYEPRYSGLLEPASRTLVFSHRGLGDHAPDNSLIASQRAMDKQMDGVDVDGQLSADGQLVIFHDLSVDRLTTGTGRVSGKTLAELKALDLGEKHANADFRGKAFVATFEDFVREITPRGILMVELKAPSAKASGMEEVAAAVIKKYDAYEKVYLSSFNPVVLYRLKQIDPRIRTVFIFMDTNWNAELLKEIKAEDLVNLPWPLRQEFSRRAIRKLIKPDALSVNNEVDEKVITRLLALGYPIFLWTIDDEARIKWALDLKPYGIISDEAELAKQLRDGQAAPQAADARPPPSQPSPASGGRSRSPS
jgi:glycerophosphoryl diester phosphodiesterase